MAVAVAVSGAHMLAHVTKGALWLSVPWCGCGWLALLVPHMLAHVTKWYRGWLSLRALWHEVALKWLES